MNRQAKNRRPQELPQELALAPELRKVLDSVGPQHYAHATARLFARGGAYSTAQRRQRYAKV